MTRRNEPGWERSRILAPAAHRRGIRATLILLDEGLCEIERWAKGRAVSSAVYEEVNDLSPQQGAELLAEVAHVRSLLTEMRQSLRIDLEKKTARVAITSLCSSMWKHAVELGWRHLKRYGDVPADLAEYLGPRISEIESGLRSMLEVSHGRHSMPHDPPSSAAEEEDV